MKKSKSEIRSASLNAKIRPHFKKMAASDDGRSLAGWLEKMIQAERERQAAKS
jgi:hypothetical protein